MVTNAQNTSKSAGVLAVDSLNEAFKSARMQDPLKAYRAAKAALDLASELEYDLGEANALNNLGVYEKQKGNYDLALKLYQKSLNLYDSLEESEGTAKALSNIGNIYSMNGDFENALKYYLRAQKLFEIKGDLRRNMQIQNNIGNVYLEKGQDQIALKYYKSVLDLYQGINDESFLFEPYSNIGKVYFNKGQLDSAFYYFNLSLKKEKQLDNKFGIASAYVRIARLQNLRGNHLQALDASITAVDIAESVGSKPILMESYSTLAEVYLHLNDIQNSYVYMNRYHLIKDSLYNESTRTAIAELEKNIELEQKEKEISLLKKEAEIRELEMKNNQLYSYGGIILLILITALAVVAYSRFRQSKRAKFLLEKQNQQILDSKKKLEIQKLKLESWNQNITDSIEYAKSIQEGIMLKNSFQDNISDSFVLFQPKDIVSGDFYWYTKVGNCDIIALIDCTGHGVAGAFMTVIANSAMNQVVLEEGMTDPAAILTRLDEKVMDTLKQKQVTSKTHSMDVALCKIDHDQQELIFAGAKRPLYVVHLNELSELKGDKYTIGEYYKTPDKKFTNHVIPLQAGQYFYMTSDGYADQFGFETQKKYMSKRLKDLLTKIADKSMLEQHKSLNLEMQRWKGEMEQTDDMLVIGFKIG